MSYVLLIVEPRRQRALRSDAEGHAAYDRMLEFSSNLKSRGLLTISQSLRTDADSIRVQVRSDRRNLLDGPFSESKEMVGGCHAFRPNQPSLVCQTAHAHMAALATAAASRPKQEGSTVATTHAPTDRFQASS